MIINKEERKQKFINAFKTANVQKVYDYYDKIRVDEEDE